jgi:hypothetical protein
MLAAAEVEGFAGYAPAIIIFAIFVWITVIMLRVSRRSKPLYDRSLIHMDRLEAKTDEMVSLLREIRDRLPPR